MPPESSAPVSSAPVELVASTSPEPALPVVPSPTTPAPDVAAPAAPETTAPDAIAKDSSTEPAATGTATPTPEEASPAATTGSTTTDPAKSDPVTDPVKPDPVKPDPTKPDATIGTATATDPTTTAPSSLLDPTKPLTVPGSISAQNLEKVLGKSTASDVVSATLTSPNFGSTFADDLGLLPADLKGLTGEAVNPNFVFDQGVATVGESGIVKVGYLNDGGKYQGQLVAFSLAGMEYLQTQADFIRIASQRGLSGSQLGAIVIDDLSQGAKYSLKMASESEWNSGDVLGDREFLFRAGDRLGFMLVPDGKVEKVAANPTVTGKSAPLFSMPSANANQQFYWGQLADVTGDGSVFVFEDQTTAGESDRDYNDLIFRLSGATMPAVLLDDVINPAKDWRTTEVGRAIVAEALPYVAPPVTGTPGELPPVLDGSDHDPVTGVGRVIGGNDQPGVIVATGDRMLDAVIDEVRDRWAGQDLSLVNVLPGIAPNPGQSPGSADWGTTIAATIDQAPERAVILLDLALTRQDETGQTVPRYTLTDGERKALERARDRGLLIVVPAGDDGRISPWVVALRDETTGRSVFPNVAVVGAAEVFDAKVAIAKGVGRATTSNYGDGLALVADGRWGQAGQALPSTRYAAARVAAVASQVWARDPQLDAVGAIGHLTRSATDLGVRGYDEETGAGLLNGIVALSLADLEPTRRAAQDLQLPDRPRASNYKLYNPGEVVQIVGAITQEAGGAAALSKLQLWLQRDGGAPKAVGQVGFTQGEAGQRYFDAKLPDLPAGKYRLLATPISQGGGQGGTLEIPFVVLSMPVNEGLSSEVRWAAERATVLESYDPAALAEASRWVVSVRAGEDVAALADRLGAANLGPTGSLPNTFYWQFPVEGRPSAEAIAAALEAQPTVEFAYPETLLTIDYHDLPWHVDAVAAGNVTADVRVKQAWENHGVSGDGVVVAIVDDGFQVSHPAFSQSRVEQAATYDFDMTIPEISNTFVTKGILKSTGEEILPGQKVDFLIGNPTLNSPQFNGKIVDLKIDALNLLEILPADLPQTVEVSLIGPKGKTIALSKLPGLGTQPITISDFNGDQPRDQQPGSAWKLQLVNISPNPITIEAPPRKPVFQFSLTTEQYHGTSVAALAIGQLNQTDRASGVAYGGDVAFRRIGAGGFEIVEGQLEKALQPPTLTEAEAIDLYNSSWGLLPGIIAPPGVLNGLKTGTNLGSTYVFSAGNQGGNVNFGSLANSMDVISVGAVYRDGSRAGYSNYGASLFVVAPTDLRTADLLGAAGDSDGDYRDTLKGTSASAPVVTGVIALMKEKNPALTARDVQHILAQSSQRSLFPTNAGWSGEAGDLVRHSPQYGFGLVDADAAVLLASTWQPIRTTSLPLGLMAASGAIPNNLPTGATRAATVSAATAEGRLADWVQVGLDLAHDDPKDLRIELIHRYTTSTGEARESVSVLADPTSSQALPPATVRNWTKGTSEDWLFSSAHHWGEPFEGEWLVRVADLSPEGEAVRQFNAWSLTLNGVTQDPPTRPLISVVARDAKATEDGNAGVFLFQRENDDLSQALTVNYFITGSATTGTDYRQLSGSVMFAAGQQYATASVIPLYDYQIEGTETVTVTVQNQPTIYELTGNSQATVALSDATADPNYAVQIFNNPATGNFYFSNKADTAIAAEAEAREVGAHLVSIGDAAENQWLATTFPGPRFSGYYWIGLTDSPLFGATEGQFQWMDGQPVSYLPDIFDQNNMTDLNPEGENFFQMGYGEPGGWNDLPEDLEVLGRTDFTSMRGLVEFNPSQIAKPIVNLSVTDSQSTEQGDRAEIVISRVGPVDQPLTVNITTSGSAQNGVDYAIGEVVETPLFSGPVIATIGANVRDNHSTVTGNIIGTRDFNQVLTFDAWAPGDAYIDYRNELGEEAGDGRWLRLAGTNSWVSSSIIDTAIPAHSGQLTIPAGQSTLRLPIVPVPDVATEGVEVGQIQLAAAGNYDLGTHAIGRVSVADTAALTGFSWVEQIGSDQSELIQALEKSKDGSLYITGLTSGSLYGNHLGASDGFIAKYDDLGNKIWSTQLGTSEDDFLVNITEDQDGNIYAIGNTFGNITNGGGGIDSQAWIAKLNKDGVVLWQKQQSRFGSQFNAVVADSAGNVYVGGAFFAGFGSNGIIRAASLTHYTADGQEKISTALEMPVSGYSAMVEEMSIDDSGNIYSIVNETPEFPRIALLSMSSSDFADKPVHSSVFKIKPNLSLDWKQEIAPNLNSIASGLDIDAAGNMYISGITNQQLGDEYKGDLDAWLLKLDNNGQKQWLKQVGTENADRSYSLSVDELTGQVYMAGTVSKDLAKSSGGNDFWVQKYDSKGFLLNQKSWGTPMNDIPVSISSLGSQGFAIGGYTGGNLANTQAGGGGDLFLAYSTWF